MKLLRQTLGVLAVCATVVVGSSCSIVKPDEPTLPGEPTHSPEVLFTPTVEPPATGPLEIKAMSYNILGGPVPDSWFPLIPRAELTPEIRAPKIVEKIKFVDADVLGLQEYEPGQPEVGYLPNLLDEYTWIYPIDNHVPILARASRFEVLDSGFEKVSKQDVNESIFDRFTTWVSLLDKDSGQRLFVLNYHAHPWQNEQQAKIRSIAIERIVDLIRNLNPELTTPIVLLGDFNASSGEKKPIFNDHLVKLKEAGLVDTADVAKKDTSDVPKAHSLHKMSAKVDGKDTAKVVKRGNLHIDYLWVPRGTQVKTWETLSGPGIKWKKIKGEKVPTWTGIIPSDHSPIIARLSFKQPK